MSSSTNNADEDAVESDPRLLFFYTYLTKSTKLKLDKWQKMMNTELYRKMIMEFLENPEIETLWMTLTSASVLVVSYEFPPASKTKSSYFARTKPEPITSENLRKCLIFGDVSPRPLDDLAVLVDEVFVPMLTNPANQKGWPSVVAEDMKRHVLELKNSVHKVRAQMKGQTLLPMPDGAHRVHQVEQRLIQSEGEVVDLQLKHNIEGSVIKWVEQITDVLRETPALVLKNVRNPLPFAEFEFWRNRVSNLQNIYEQLTDPRVNKMASILQLTDSAYYPSFKTIFRNVVADLKEAKEISKYLKPLEKYVTRLDGGDLIEGEPLLAPTLHIVALTWVHCKYYCSSAKVTYTIQLIANMLMEMANKFLDPSSIFQGEVQETIVKVKQVIDILERFG